MTHIEFIDVIGKVSNVAKVVNGIIASNRWSIGGSMVLELRGKLGRDVHDIDIIFEFETKDKAILAYQLLDRVLLTLGVWSSKSYANLDQEVWSIEFKTPLLPYPINILFRETDHIILNSYLGIMWQPLCAVELWKKKWNRPKDREDLK